MSSHGQVLRTPVHQVVGGYTVGRYVLVTAAYNEADNIKRLIESVIAQSLLPARWVIVADGCTDRTAEIVLSYVAHLPFLELVELHHQMRHDFASKVRAFHTGAERLGGAEFEFIGNLDADVSVEHSYFFELLAKFQQNPRLGIAGGAISEWNGREFVTRPSNTVTDVAGAVQMFRRECYQAIGGFLPLRYGGEDWAAQVCAQMAGWHVETFPELIVHHYHPPNGVRGILCRGVRQGLMDFTMGTRLLFELARLARRAGSGTGLPECLARLGGFLWGCLRNEKRLVSAEFVTFLRAQQRRKLRGYLASVCRLRSPVRGR